jgi:uncharacterized protein
MRISDMRRGLFWVLLVAGALFAGPLPSEAAAPSPTPATVDEFATADRAFRDGHVADGIETLAAAARKGGIRAQLRLAKLYSEGKLVPRDEVKSCELFGALADRHSQVDRTDPAAKYIAEAFRSWAMCYLRGMKAPGWEQNVSRAAVLFYQAGVMLDDPESQYELAKMYLTGQGISQNPRLAVYYFFSAARKRFAPSQAMLGSLMYEGRVLKRQPVNGLALMMLALDGSKPEEKAWIDRLYQDALLTASRDEEKQAQLLMQDWKRAYDAETTGTTSPPLVTATPSVPPPVKAPGAPQQQLQGRAPSPAGAPVAKSIQQNEYNTTPTGADVPPAASPVD